MPVSGSAPALLDGPEWKAYFRNFKRSAFRLEVHQVYTMPAEAETLHSFLAGESMPDGFNATWHQTIRGQRSAGRTMTRAKLVRRPLTDYSRYLFGWAIPGNVEAGEDYRIVDVTERDVDLPNQDFWMFDETTVVHLTTAPTGRRSAVSSSLPLTSASTSHGATKPWKVQSRSLAVEPEHQAGKGSYLAGALKGLRLASAPMRAIWGHRPPRSGRRVGGKWSGESCDWRGQGRHLAWKMLGSSTLTAFQLNNCQRKQLPCVKHE
ncbi:MAG TPA: hypothetical protein VFG16_27445 [Streptomyces sp.]|nr:DUF6879 family protein [Streptomyces sp.]HET6357905.1 hypothetical protein [Streptomyces sp.]